MRKYNIISIVSAILCALPLSAQNRPRSASASPAANATGDYVTDVGVVLDAQGQALDQAKQILEGGDGTGDNTELQTVIKQMELSRAALEEAKKSPEKLTTALAAEQSAYQALLKALPREYRVSRSRSQGQRGGGSSSGQPGEEELSQLELTGQDNRYETERQASPTQTPQQREQAETADRLKQLARRQQDLNDRLRDLQTALQEAKTDQEREEVQNQLKRLRDEERQMLADTDELRQKLEQSPNAEQQAGARQQLEQTRNDVQKAAQEMESQSVSEALAAGSRAEEKMQNLRENLRQQTSSQFTQQMRQLQNQARDLADQEDKISRNLNALNDAKDKPLDDSAQRKPLVEQMARQESALTNLTAQMRTLTEQSEATEPLLSKQLYDILRREDQKHTDSQLEIGAQLVDRGFLPQASQTESVARTNLNELRQGVETAAESVLGSEADALRYAQKELDDLAGQLARELSAGTNSSPNGARNSAGRGQQESQTGARGRAGNQGGNGGADTNETASADSNPGSGEEGHAAGERNSAQNTRGGGRNGQRGGGNNPGDSSQTQRSGNPGGGRNGSGADQAGQNATAENQAGGEAGGGNDGRDQLRQIARQLGGGAGGIGLNNGPITGNNYMDWSDRLRDVEQAVDSQDVRNQLATVRERVSEYRRNFRLNGQIPPKEELQAKALEPLVLARDWVNQELSRAQKDRSLVPLDRNPVQDKYSEAVRKYYEKLGSPQ